MEPVGYLRLLSKYLPFVLALAVLGALVAGGVAAALPRTYTAQSTLFLEVQSSSTLYERSQFALQRVQSYPPLLKSPAVLQAVIDRLHLGTTTQQLAKDVTATNPPNTVLVNVAASAPTGTRAAAIANEAASQLATSVDAMENQQTLTKNAVRLTTQIAAQAPSGPSSPAAAVIVGLGALLGLVAGILLALLLDAVLPVVRSSADVRRISGLPVIGALPWTDLRPGARARVTAAGVATADHLGAITRGHLPPMVLLAPAGGSANNPLIRYQLAHGLAESGRRVLVVETDAALRPPRHILAPGAPGMTDVLAERADADSVVVPHATGRVDVVPVGDMHRAPTAVEVERRLESALQSVGRDHDITVLQASTDSVPVRLQVLAPVARGVLVVVSHRWTTERALRRVTAELRSLGITPIGVLMVHAPRIRQIETVEQWRETDFLAVSTGRRRPREQEAAGRDADRSAPADGRTHDGLVRALAASSSTTRERG